MKSGIEMIEVYLRMAMAMYSSETVMHLSTSGRAVARALTPTLGTARPSASVESAGVYTGWPLVKAAWKLAQRSDSTPMICTCGYSDLMASAMPAIRPPPPTGITTASMSFTFNLNILLVIGFLIGINIIDSIIIRFDSFYSSNYYQI